MQSAGKHTSPESDREALIEAEERAERAEQELALLKRAVGAPGLREDAQPRNTTRVRELAPREGSTGDGTELLRAEPMMAHLLDSLEAGKDIGHYGRLVFAMVAHHFLSEEEVLAWLRKDRDFSEEAAAAMLRQVEGRDYNPPRRERILEWQAEQEFPIIPNPEDPDCGNVYRNLKFPEAVYEDIQSYQEKKAEADR